jgi:hypothetical protein
MAAADDCNVPTLAFTSYDLFDKVTKTIIEDLKCGIPFFNNILIGNGFFSFDETQRDCDPEGVREVVRGEARRVSHPMFIRVIYRGLKSEWQATRVRDDTYSFYIDCLTKNTAEAEVEDEQIVLFGSAVHNYTIRFNNLQPIIIDTNPKIRAYDSWTDEGMQIATVNQHTGVYRMARIGYYIKVMNPYTGFTTAVCN